MDGAENEKSWRPQIKLQSLFIVTAVAACAVWFSPLGFIYSPGLGLWVPLYHEKAFEDPDAYAAEVVSDGIYAAMLLISASILALITFLLIWRRGSEGKRQ